MKRAALTFLMLWPLINDITTTPDAPPQFKTLAGGAPYPASFAPLQRQAYPDLAPIPLALPPAQAFDRVKKAAQAMGWKTAAEDAAAFRLEAVATTFLLRFKDDIVVEVRPDGGASAVHARSRSRVGKGDLGANARRLRAFRETLLGAR